LFLGDTRLGLMWTCMTLFNRPQVCFTPDLRLEWLLALVSIFIGCICITTTIILLASSHWDRNVIPYARWVGFTASKSDWICFRAYINLQLFIFFSGTILFCCRCISHGFSYTRDWRSTISTTKQPSSWHIIYFICVVTLGNCNIWVICWKSMFTPFLKALMDYCWLICFCIVKLKWFQVWKQGN